MLDTGGLTSWVCSNCTDHNKSAHSFFLTVRNKFYSSILINICCFLGPVCPPEPAVKDNRIKSGRKEEFPSSKSPSIDGTPSAVNFVCCLAISYQATGEKSELAHIFPLNSVPTFPFAPTIKTFTSSGLSVRLGYGKY